MVRAATGTAIVLLAFAGAGVGVRAEESTSKRAPARLEQVFLELVGMG